MVAAMTKPDLASAAVLAAVWPPVLAIDPGSQSTGICLRVGTNALEAITVERLPDHGDHQAVCHYAAWVVETAREMTRRNRDALNAAAAERGVDPGSVRHAVETLVAPTGAVVKGRRAAVAPRVLAHLPVASTVLGTVIGTWPQTILVPPRGGDTGGWDALDGTPKTLRGRTPTGWIRDGVDRSHQRAAWALAGAAHSLGAAPLPAQVAAAIKAAGSPTLDPTSLVPALTAAITKTGSWDLLGRLPSLAAAVAAKATGSRADAEQVRAAVAAHLGDI